MATQKQIDANRRNAQLSTGPRTVEGKAVSSQNAFKTGIWSDAEVADFEHRENLDALKAEYYDRFSPTSPEQRWLVDTLINSEWLLRRFRMMDCEVADRWRDTLPLEDASKQRAPIIREFEMLNRRINATNRTFFKTLETLKALKAEETSDTEAEKDARSSTPEPSEAKPLLMDNQPLTNEIGFVPQNVSAAPPKPIGTAPNCSRTAESKAYSTTKVCLVS